MPLALIVGAGIGGLAAGLALRRAGWEIRIFERAAAARAIGFGLGLAPNAMAALRELGVAAAVAAEGVTPLAGEVRRADGTVLRRMIGRAEDLPAGDRPVVIMRPVLHRALLEAIGRDRVETDREAVRFDADGTRVRLTLRSGETATGDVLVGADGVGSAIRAQLHPADPPPRSSGYFAVRGASPAIDRLAGLQAIWYFGRGVESGVVQAGPQAIYWFVSLLAADVRSGPLDVHSVMQRRTAGFDRQFQEITAATATGDMRLDELLERAPLAQWGAGPVTLLGDAAHPMLPFTAQGAAQALEDAVALGRVLGNSGDHRSALRRYEQARARRTRPIVNMGPRIARVTTTKNPVITFLRNAAIRVVPQSVILKGFTESREDPHHDLA